MPSSFQISSKFSTHWHDMQWILFQTAICFSSAIFDMHFRLKILTVTSPKYGMHKFKCSFSKGDPSRGVVSFSLEARISAIAERPRVLHDPCTSTHCNGRSFLTKQLSVHRTLVTSRSVSVQREVMDAGQKLLLLRVSLTRRSVTMTLMRRTSRPPPTPSLGRRPPSRSASRRLSWPPRPDGRHRAPLPPAPR